jgi:ankyrin repeat protein
VPALILKIEYGSTPLHIAAQRGHLEVVEVLLKFVAGIDCKDKDGITALHIASEEGHKQTVVALLEHGSDINIVSKNNMTPLDFARSGNHSFHKKVYNYEFILGYNFNLGRGINFCEGVADILKCHIVKMKNANLFLSKKKLPTISNNDEKSDFQNGCEKKIASMKSEKVGNANVSFYDILTKGIKSISNVCRK